MFDDRILDDRMFNGGLRQKKIESPARKSQTLRVKYTVSFSVSSVDAIIDSVFFQDFSRFHAVSVLLLVFYHASHQMCT